MRDARTLPCPPAPAWAARWPARSHAAPRLIALLLGVIGTLNLLSALTPELAPRLHLVIGLVGLDAVRCSRTASVIAGLVLLMLGRSVARRNRRAARVALVALVVAAVLNLLKGLDIEEAAGCLFAAGMIWRYRAEFVVGALPISWRAALSRSLWLAGLIVVYAQAGALLLGRNVQVELTVGASGDPLPFPIASFLGLWTDAPTVRYLGPQGHWFRHSLHAIIALGLLCAVIRLLQPLIPAPLASGDERRRARALLARHGTDTLCYFHLRPDRRYIFAPDDAGFVSFVVRGDVALLGGDPLAAPGALHSVVRHAVEILTLQGLSLCVVGASTGAMHAYRSAGLRAIKMGEEAVIRLPAFGRERLAKRVRRAARHVEGLGIAIRIGTMADTEPALAAQCAVVSRAWLERHAGREQGFSMTSGPLPGPRDHDHLLVLAVETAIERPDRVLGFVTLAPIPAGAGLSLDHMRRLPDAPNGLMEALIIGAAEHCRDQGYATLSLNFAALCDEEHPEGEAAPLRAARKAVFVRASHLPLRSLYLFNKKFDPEWSCRYWLYQGTDRFPAAAYATIRAETSVPFLLSGALSAAFRPRSAR